MLACPAYAASQRPSALAASTWARPAARIRPSAVSRATLTTLFADQMLRGRRGVKRCQNEVASPRRTWPSIQPWQIASSKAWS